MAAPIVEGKEGRSEVQQPLNEELNKALYVRAKGQVIVEAKRYYTWSGGNPARTIDAKVPKHYSFQGGRSGLSTGFNISPPSLEECLSARKSRRTTVLISQTILRNSAKTSHENGQTHSEAKPMTDTTLLTRPYQSSVFHRPAGRRATTKKVGRDHERRVREYRSSFSTKVERLVCKTGSCERSRIGWDARDPAQQKF